MSAWSGRRVTSARQTIRRRGRHQPCWRCGRGMDLDVDTWTVGHIVDRAAGGTDRPDNIAAECPGCNYRAGGRRGAQVTNARRRVGGLAVVALGREQDRGIRGW